MEGLGGPKKLWGENLQGKEIVMRGFECDNFSNVWTSHLNHFSSVKCHVFDSANT